MIRGYFHNPGGCSSRGIKRTFLPLGLMLFTLLSQLLTAPAGAASQPTLRIAAPKRVQVGQPITLTLRVQDAVDIAGFETTLLYNPAVVEFSGLGQRQNDLRRFKRDVAPLGPAEFTRGVAFGFASCPTADCSVRTGVRQSRGGKGTLTLATISVKPTRAGALQLRFAATKFVDASGATVTVAQATPAIVVQVGIGGPAFAAPATPWTLAPSTAPAAVADVTSDGLVSNADAMEVALAWTVAREGGLACGTRIDRTHDINRDGCLDIGDLQRLVSRYSAPAATPQPLKPAKPPKVKPATPSSGKARLSSVTPTYVVTSTADTVDANLNDGICATAAGVCTLRAAIAQAGRRPGPDTIAFDIPGSGVHTITIASTLPTINDASGPTTIDGYTQPGSLPNTLAEGSNAVIRIEVAGPGYNSFDGLMITSKRNVVRGLSFYNLKNCIRIFGVDAVENTLAGNFIGTDATATMAAAGRIDGNGVQLHQGAARNAIGTPALADRNIISGNGLHGIMTSNERTNDNMFYNNVIGLDPTGTRRVINWRVGIDINSRSSNNLIGGTGLNEANVVSGNGYEGIELSHDTLTVGNRVVGNRVGTDLSGTRAYPYTINEQHGIHIEDGVQNNIVAENVVGNNKQGGIYFTGFDTYNNQALNNRVGISLDGTPIPNMFYGVQVGYHAARSKVGPGNMIAYNPVGVIVANADNLYNPITRNAIFANTGLGIDLGPLGVVNPNDVGDTDAGPNNALNYPVLTSARPGEVLGTACAGCTVEIFVADRGEGANGQGKTFVGTVPVTPAGTFNAAVANMQVGDFITATATDAAGNTSEFALNRVVTATRTPVAFDTFTRTASNGWGTAETGGAYSITGTAADFAVNGSVGMIRSAAGQSRGALLANATALDTDHTFRVQTDKTPGAGSLFVYAVARRVNSSNEYQGRLRFDPSGRVYLQASAIINNVVNDLSAAVLVPGVTHSAGAAFRLRMEVVGTSPTTIRMKTWLDGQAEPASWHYTITDARAVLQRAGSTGLRTYVSSSLPNGPIIFAFDDFEVKKQ